MPVVAAGVHPPVVPRAVLEPRRLLDRKRVHVRAKPHRARRVAGTKRPDHAGAADAAVDLEPEFLEPLRHQVGRAVLLEAELGVGVNVAPPGGHLVVERADAIDCGHGSDSSIAGEAVPRTDKACAAPLSTRGAPARRTLRSLVPSRRILFSELSQRDHSGVVADTFRRYTGRAAYLGSVTTITCLSGTGSAPPVSRSVAERVAGARRHHRIDVEHRLAGGPGQDRRVGIALGADSCGPSQNGHRPLASRRPDLWRRLQKPALAAVAEPGRPVSDRRPPVDARRRCGSRDPTNIDVFPILPTGAGQRSVVREEATRGSPLSPVPVAIAVWLRHCRRRGPARALELAFRTAARTIGRMTRRRQSASAPQTRAGGARRRDPVLRIRPRSGCAA